MCLAPGPHASDRHYRRQHGQPEERRPKAIAGTAPAPGLALADPGVSSTICRVLFNSLPFLYLFLPITYFVFWRLNTKNQRYFWLTLTGYVFYGFWNYKFCALMAFSTAVSYLAGLGFLRWSGPEHRRQRKLCLVVPIVIDLALLGFFKYFNFTLETVNATGRLLGLDVQAPRFDVILPIGISFYTFHTISYIVDSYRGVIRPTRNLFEFSCYVSLFSQLVAGPIVRFRQIEEDLDNIGDKDRPTDSHLGWSFFMIGLIKKVLIADSIAAVIDPALSSSSTLTFGQAWLCALGYTYQLYFDFSGYSDMAVGLGYLFNIRIPQNFNSPYKADGIADFWRRWHISLSSCLRDYVYIPLGGNRKGTTRTYVNLLLTMGIGGLWHGANWTFVIWGIYHGALLSLERLMKPAIGFIPKLMRQAITFILIVVGWVVFRAENLDMAGRWLAAMFVPTDAFIARMPGQLGLTLLLLIAGLIAHMGRNTFEMKHRWSTPTGAAMTLLFLAALFSVTAGQPSPFLYFQF